MKYPPGLRLNTTSGDNKWANGVRKQKHDLDMHEKIIYGTDV